MISSFTDTVLLTDFETPDRLRFVTLASSGENHEKNQQKRMSMLQAYFSIMAHFSAINQRLTAVRATYTVSNIK